MRLSKYLYKNYLIGFDIYKSYSLAYELGVFFRCNQVLYASFPGDKIVFNFGFIFLKWVIGVTLENRQKLRPISL